MDAIGLFSDEELVGTCEDSFIAADFDLFFSFLLLHPVHHRVGAAYHAGILSAANRAEVADDVEQMKKIVPFVTCEITFGQHVCELMFGINVSNLNFRVKIKSVKKKQSRATL